MKLFSLDPLINEKSYSLSKDSVYVFRTSPSLNLAEIKKEIEKDFEVKVVKINSALIKGKVKRTISITGRRQGSRSGSRSKYKKVYVRLAKGTKLPFFESVEEETKKEEKSQKQFDKAIAKNILKDDRKVKKLTGNLNTKKRFSLRKQPESK
jgi:large subunit ribosomal protein L23